MADIASQIRLPDWSGAQNSLQGLVGLKGAMLQQRALDQQFGANQAASQAAQAAIDPATGQIDQAKFAQALSGTPYAYNIPEYLSKFQQLQNTQLDTQSKRFDIAQKQLGFWNSQLGGMMAQGANITPQTVMKSLANGVQLGMITPEQAQHYATQVPAGGQELQDWVKNHWISLQGAKEQAAILMPNVQAIDTGGGVNIVPIDPLSGQVKGGITSMVKSLDPATAAQRINVFDPTTGQQGTMPLGATVGGGQGAGGNGGFLPTSPTMGQQKIADAAAERFNSLTDAANNAPTAINGYDRALEALSAANTSGRAADAKLFIPTILQSLGLQSEGGMAENYQTLKKYLANAGAQAASAAGYSGSDARLASFTSGQPDPEKMNPAALADAINYVKALQSGVLAKSNAAQAYLDANGGNTAKLPTFERKWANAFNPDVMELRNMAPEQQQAYVASLKPEARKKLMDSYRKMAEVGAW